VFAHIFGDTFLWGFTSIFFSHSEPLLIRLVPGLH
jgi:hypothetical protein